MMTQYTVPSMKVLPWAAPNLDPTYQNVPQGAWPSTGLGDPHFVMSVDWDWPTDNYWSHFMIVRSTRSPARRAEEGQWMLDRPMKKSDWADIRMEGTPFFIDPQPPPGEWTFYNFFFLDVNRVWCPGGHVYDMGPADHDWTLRLPELLPGTAISVERGTTHPADQASDLVQFLQGPAVFLDIAVSMAEAMQYFWNPHKVPPQLLGNLAKSWGYPYDQSLGAGRTREVLAVLRRPSQGSLASIGAMAEAAAGCEAAVLMSDNMMLNTADSSFEVSSGDIADTAWEPIYTTPGNDSTKLRIYSYVDHPTPIPIAPPNIQLTSFLHVPNARKLVCGYRNPVAPETARTLDPIKCGIPISDWTKIRMGCYAVDYPPLTSTTITMGMDLYDYAGVFLDSITVVPSKTMSDVWQWFGSGSGGVADSVPITLTQPDSVKTDVLTNTTLWTAGSAPYALPQSLAPIVSSGMQIRWDAAASPSSPAAFRGVTSYKEALHDNWTYRISMTVKGSANAATWRPRFVNGPAGETVVPDAAGTPQTVAFDWRCDGRSSLHLGIEVAKPTGGWGVAGTHTVTAFSIKRVAATPAYGVPWVDVSNACWVDLIVVDDG